MLIFPAVVLLLAGAIFILAILRLPGRTAWLLGLYLLCYANIVLVGEIANSFYQLNNQWLWLALHMALAVAAWLTWRRTGRPDLWAGFRIHCDCSKFWMAVRRWPELCLLAAGVGLGFVFNAVLIWLVPPNNNDSLATHMSRIGYWLQRGSFFPWETDRIWQVTYPVNMQLQIFWTVLFQGTDRIVEIVQWLGALAAVVAVFGLARLLGATRAQSLFAALVWATFPEVVLEATTTQNDLVAGTLFAAVIYLLFLGVKMENTGSLILSGIAMGLSLGTKQTLFFLIPGVAIGIFLLIIYRDRASRMQTMRRLMVWGSSAAAAFIFLGLYMFVVNMVNFNHPMGPETAVSSQTGGQTSRSLRENLLYNSLRLAYQSVDPTGLPEPFTGYGFKLKALLVSKVTSLVGFDMEAPVAVAPRHAFHLRERYLMQEDAAWYGPLFAFLVLPALLYQFWKGIRMKDPLRVSLLIIAVTFWLLDAAFRPGWDPFQGRYFIPVVIVSTSTAAFLFQPGKRMLILRLFMVILGLTVLTNTFLWNAAKPIDGEENIWVSDRVNMITRQSFYMREPLLLVEKHVPADAVLGLVTYDTFLEYPFFREDFSRRLVHIYPPEQVQDVDWLKGQGIEFVLLLNKSSVPSVSFPQELVPFAGVGQWSLFTWGLAD